MKESSLARKTLFQLGVWAAVVILGMTTVAFIHVTNVVTRQSLEYLEKYVAVRGEHDSDIFKLAEENHVVIKNELIRLLENSAYPDYKKEFNRLFEKYPDGTVRRSTKDYDGLKHPFGFIGQNVDINDELKRRIIIFYRLSERFGPAWHHRLQNLYFTSPENLIIAYWPEYSDWAHVLPAEMNLNLEEYVWVADKEHNPKRETVWTGLFYDIGSSNWMVSVETPVDYQGKQIATIGHDILLNELLNRTVDIHLKGTYNLIFRDDGRLIAHPDKLEEIKKEKGYFDIHKSADDNLKRIYELVTKKHREKNVIENVEFDEYLAVSRIEQPGWFFVTVYPKSLVIETAFNTARLILLLGFLSLMFELLILWWVIRENVSEPIGRFLEAVNEASKGNLDIQLDISRQDEIGSFARAFNAMTTAIKERENEIKIAYSELEYSQLRFASMFESMPDAVVMTDTERHLTIVNDATIKLFGYDEDNLLGNTTSLLYAHPEDFNQTGKTRYNIDSKTDSLPYEVEYRRKDGTVFWGETLGTKIISENGFAYGFVGIIRDVTERKNAENELRKHRYQLEELVDARTKELRDVQDELIRKERLATLGQLTATVSHELRNPLGAMRPSLYIIRKKIDEKDERARQAIELINRNIVRCDQIIDELLDYTRITELNRLPVRIDEWLETIINEQNIPDGIRIEKDFSLYDFALAIDGNRLRRAVINVVENACHSMLDDNRVVTSINNSRLCIKTKHRDNRIEISVSDSGVGISNKVMEKIFEPLFSTKGFGVGLGMSIVKQIMEQHDGGIEITTEENIGTTVILWLPTFENIENDDGMAV